MAGFEVTLYGRFWVTPEVSVCKGMDTHRLGMNIVLQKRFAGCVFSSGRR